MPDKNRLEKLDALKKYVREKIQKDEEVHLIFVCVQNSRRSHLSQVLAADVIDAHGLSHKIKTYSGGVEVTRIHPSTIECLKKMGYEIVQQTEGDNPVFELWINKNHPPIQLYSKNFEDITPHLPSFAAVMVCSEAETNCPYVPGAEKKFLLPYNDPKIYDDTNTAVDEYLKLAMQIREEMEYVFSNIPISANNQ
ncbi:MAG: hypothetical protein Fur0023_19770 [Bacteroidia bacterium]